MDTLSWATNFVCELFRLRTRRDEIHEELITDDEDDEIIVDGKKRSRHSCVSCREPRPILKRRPTLVDFGPGAAGPSTSAQGLATTSAAKRPEAAAAEPQETAETSAANTSDGQDDAQNSGRRSTTYKTVTWGRNIDVGVVVDDSYPAAAVTSGMDVKEPAEFSEPCCPETAKPPKTPEIRTFTPWPEDNYNMEEAAAATKEDLEKPLKLTQESPSTSFAARRGMWETFEEDSPVDCSEFSDEEMSK